VPEDTRCVPISYCAASKLASESHLRLAANEGLNAVCLRFYKYTDAVSNLDYGMVSSYLAYLLQGTSVPVTGSLDRYRDFVHVDDAVDSLARGLAGTRAPFEVFNIGTGTKTTVRKLCKAYSGDGVAARASDRRASRFPK